MGFIHFEKLTHLHGWILLACTPILSYFQDFWRKASTTLLSTSVQMLYDLGWILGGWYPPWFHTFFWNFGGLVPPYVHALWKMYDATPLLTKRLWSGITKSLRLPRETHRFGASSNPPRLPTFLQPSQTPAPATHFETYRNPCACHENHFELQKVVRDPGVLTILTSKSCWRAGVVQILPTSTSKSRPRLSVFNDFDFQNALARRRGANFGDFNFQKCSRTLSF